MGEAAQSAAWPVLVTVHMLVSSVGAAPREVLRPPALMAYPAWWWSGEAT
jgi:hypothetical protein